MTNTRTEQRPASAEPIVEAFQIRDTIKEHGDTYEHLVALIDDANIEGVSGNICRGAEKGRTPKKRKKRKPRIDLPRIIPSISQISRWQGVDGFVDRAWPKSDDPDPWKHVERVGLAGMNPVYVLGEHGEEVDDHAIKVTLDCLRDKPKDVMLFAHDGGYADLISALAGDAKRRVFVAGFKEKLSRRYHDLEQLGLIRTLDLEYDLRLSNTPFPRPDARVIPRDEFDPERLLAAAPSN